jgi:hypothetical protein
MVTFTFVPLTDPRLTPQIKAQFLNVGQLINWKLTDASGTYTGLIVVGEKPHPQGFQSMAEVMIDIPEKGIPMEKVRELGQTVQTEFVQRGVVGYFKKT